MWSPFLYVKWTGNTPRLGEFFDFSESFFHAVQSYVRLSISLKKLFEPSCFALTNFKDCWAIYSYSSLSGITYCADRGTYFTRFVFPYPSSTIAFGFVLGSAATRELCIWHEYFWILVYLILQGILYSFAKILQVLKTASHWYLRNEIFPDKSDSNLPPS